VWFLGGCKESHVAAIRLARHICVVLMVSMAFLLSSFPQALPQQEHSIRFTQVSQELIETRLRRALPDNADRESTLKDIFGEVGCTGALLAEQPIKRQKSENVICTLQGTSDSVMIVGAHFDHVAVGDGVVDNWSGASLLPSLYQSLKDVPRKHTVLFIGFAAEEEGLVGSEFYVKQLRPEQVTKIQVMINMDSLGLGPTNLWMTHSDEKLAEAMNGVAASMKIPLGVVDGDKIGDEDSTSFRKRHIPTIMIHSISQQTLPILHSRYDNLTAIRSDDYYDTYRLLTEYLAVLDGRLP
jgi:hypothetical protein